MEAPTAYGSDLTKEGYQAAGHCKMRWMYTGGRCIEAKCSWGMELWTVFGFFLRILLAARRVHQSQEGELMLAGSSGGGARSGAVGRGAARWDGVVCGSSLMCCKVITVPSKTSTIKQSIPFKIATRKAVSMLTVGYCRYGWAWTSDPYSLIYSYRNPS